MTQQPPTSRARREKTRKLAVAGLLAALCLILGLTPLGFIPIGPVKLTIMHIPVLIGAVLEGPVVGLALGAVFGLTSLYQAVAMPTNPVQVVFQNPLISVLPRLLMPLAAYGAHRLFIRRDGAPRLRGLPGDAAAAAVGTLANTVFTLAAMDVFGAGTLMQLLSLTRQDVHGFVLGIGVANAPLEAIGAVIVATPVLAALRRSVYRHTLPARPKE